MINKICNAIKISILLALSGCASSSVTEALQSTHPSNEVPIAFDYFSLSQTSETIYVTFSIHRDTQAIKLDRVSEEFNLQEYFQREYALYSKRLQLGCLKISPKKQYALCFQEDKVSGGLGSKGIPELTPHYRSIYHANHKWDYTLIPEVGNRTVGLLYADYKNNSDLYKNAITKGDNQEIYQELIKFVKKWPGDTEAQATIGDQFKKCLASCSPEAASTLIELSTSGTKNPLNKENSNLLLSLTLKLGNFSQVISLARRGEAAALKRAYDISSSDSERKQIDNVIVNKIKDKLFSINAKMRGTGKVKSSDSDLWIARSIESEITSNIEYTASANRKIMVPKFNYRLNGRIVVEVRGRVNGERNCGLLWLGKCKIDDNNAIRTYEKPIVIDLMKSTGHKTTGLQEIAWKSISGGSGMAGGLMMGGTQIFSASEVHLLVKIDSVDSI